LKSPIERRIEQLVVATGIASVVTQLLLIREFMAQFQGNEVTIALVLFNWLVLGGVGTRAALGATGATPARLALLSWGLAALGPVQMAAIRLLRPAIFGIGLSVGFYPIFGFSLLTMAPYALLVGYVLPYSLFALRRSRPAFGGTRIYLADNLGDIGGGALFTFVLVVWVSPMQAMLWAHLPLVVAAARLVSGKRRWVGMVAAVLCLVLGVAGEQALLRPPVGRMRHYEESRFARLTVQQDQEQTTLFADGRPVAGTQDAALAEQIVHYPLSQLDRVSHMLLISAHGGVMEEIAKYRPTGVDYVELDPAVAGLMEQYGLTRPMAGLTPIVADGREWLRHSGRKYDAILLNLPEPDTFQLNRFFTERFFRLAADRLNPDGIFSFSVEGAANYLTAAQRRKISSLWATARRHFRQVQLLPGERIFFLCRQTPVDLDIPLRLARLGIATQVAGPYFHGDMTAERIGSLEQSLDPQVPINYDMQPYLMQVVWEQWFTKFGASPYPFWAFMGIFLLLSVARMRREEYILFSTGLLAMGSQIVLIFAFQIFLGYIYGQIGMLVTASLAGLLPGAWLGSRWQRTAAGLIAADLAIMLLLAGVMACLQWAGDRLPAGFYYTAGFSLALACGFQIPLALARLGDDNRAAARIFSVDLAGAAFGALLTSMLLIPYLGLGGAVAALMAVKVVSLVLMGGVYGSHGSTHFHRR
jgi:spermidine synthase